MEVLQNVFFSSVEQLLVKEKRTGIFTVTMVHLWQLFL